MNSEQIRKFFADYQVVLKRVEQLEAAMRIKSDWYNSNQQGAL